MGSVKTFLHPLVVVNMLVFVVTTDPGVLVTWVVSVVCSLVKANTFRGARSKGFSMTRTPADASSSTISPESSLRSPLPESELELVNASLDNEVEHWLCRRSTSTKADRTSKGSEDHASSTDDGKVPFLSAATDLRQHTKQ